MMTDVFAFCTISIPNPPDFIKRSTISQGKLPTNILHRLPGESEGWSGDVNEA